MQRRVFIKMASGSAAGLIIGGRLGRADAAGVLAAGRNKRMLVPPASLSKFTEQLVIPPIYDLRGGGRRTITMRNGTNTFHSALGQTPTMGYDAPYLGPVLQVFRGIPVQVEFANALTNHPLASAIDTAIMGAEESDKTAPRTSVHVHGGETEPQFDGHPHDWFRPGDRKLYRYLNRQEAGTMWYHDHALGITRLNVYAGLASGYLIRDLWDNGTRFNGASLPYGEFEVPLVLQDKSFNDDGTMAYSLRENPPVDAPPLWVPEFFGDVAVVNGKVWPNLDVARGLYRFRLFNGAQARFFNLGLSNGSPIHQIGTDGGLLDAPVRLNKLLLAPGERADVLIDFSALRRGEQVTLTNDAPEPFPFGDPSTVTELMRFTVKSQSGIRQRVPSRLRLAPIKRLRQSDAIVVRNVILSERMDAATGTEPIGAFLNNLPFHGVDDSLIERPRRGTVEQWNIINLTGDTHPIHLHLVQFQVLGRQPFDADAYAAAHLGPFGTKVSATADPLATGPMVGPDANERGWKDTVRANPGEITRILVPFNEIDFATDRPYQSVDRARTIQGYVWHCHILEHEENDMMQPYRVLDS